MDFKSITGCEISVKSEKGIKKSDYNSLNSLFSQGAYVKK